MTINFFHLAVHLELEPQESFICGCCFCLGDRRVKRLNFCSTWFFGDSTLNGRINRSFPKRINGGGSLCKKILLRLQLHYDWRNSKHNRGIKIMSLNRLNGKLMAIDHILHNFPGHCAFHRLRHGFVYIASVREMNLNRALFVCARKKGEKSREKCFRWKSITILHQRHARKQLLLFFHSQMLANSNVRFMANYFSAQRNINRTIYDVISLLLRCFLNMYDKKWTLKIFWKFSN